MAVHHLTVTLTGAAQQLSAPVAGVSINCKELQIQGESGGAAVYIGGTNAVSSTDYGQSIAATSVTPVVMRPPGMTTINLASTWVIGTNGNKIHLLYIQ